MMRYDALGEYVELAARGAFTVPVARTFALDDWREAQAWIESRFTDGRHAEA